MKKNFYIVFTDLKGFSRLLEDDVVLFQGVLIPTLANQILEYREQALVWNTWGDAIFAAFEDGNAAVTFMLEYRAFFRTFAFESNGVKRLSPRIAGHFGQGEHTQDRIYGNLNIFGSNINTAARIEPITRAGEAFVTKEFRDAFIQIPGSKRSVRFNELGVLMLAKDFGDREVYRLCDSTEQSQIADRLLPQDLISFLPDIPDLNDDEKRHLNYFSTSPDSATLLESVNQIDKTGSSLPFLFETARLLKKFGLFSTALEYLDHLENSHLLVDSMRVFPLRHRTAYLKLRANVLTRLQKYEQAADIAYGLWHSGHKDPDTLSMLAAQYKRRSIYGDSGQISPATLNSSLLSRALNLYLEAFRLDIENLYPAINAAYIYKIIGGLEEGKGNKLAQYIIHAWEGSPSADWWLLSSIAEAHLLMGDYQIAEALFKKAIEEADPDRFMIEATLEQIQLYATLRGLEEYTQECLDTLAARRN